MLLACITIVYLWPYIMGTNYDEFSQHVIGRSHTSSCQSGFLGTGRRTRLCHLVEVHVAHCYSVLFRTHKHSVGARACVGRRCELFAVYLSALSSRIPSRFAETEGIATITMVVSRYKIEVKEEPEFVGETFEERYARVTAFRQSLTTT